MQSVVWELLLREGKAAEEGASMNTMEVARALYAACHVLSGRPEAQLLAANVQLRQGEADAALSEYEAALAAGSLTPRAAAVAERKRDEAAEIVSKGATTLFGTPRKRSESRSAPPDQGPVNSLLLREALAANQAEECMLARELFNALYVLSGKTEARLSAANMTLKLGDYDEALAEYDKLLATCELSKPAVDVVTRKRVEAAAAKKAAGKKKR